MTHYIIDGGRFQNVARALIADGWQVRYTSPVESDDDKARRVARKASKTKYNCPVCDANAWGKPGLTIGCATGHALVVMTETDA
jgi:hypothetical protein